MSVLTFFPLGLSTLLDLTEQFAPPEMAPSMLLKLLEAIEKKGISVAYLSCVRTHRNCCICCM